MGGTCNLHAIEECALIFSVPMQTPAHCRCKSLQFTSAMSARELCLRWSPGGIPRYSQCRHHVSLTLLQDVRRSRDTSLTMRLIFVARHGTAHSCPLPSSGPEAVSRAIIAPAHPQHRDGVTGRMSPAASMFHSSSPRQHPVDIEAPSLR